MSIFKKILVLLIALVSLVDAQEDPVSYINEAIDKLEKNWEKRDTVDWQDIRTRYSEQVRDVKAIEETYPVIRTLLQEFGDSWNYLEVPGVRYEVPHDQTGFRVMLPDWVLVYVFDESPAAKAGMKVGDQIIAVNGKPITSRDAVGAPRTPPSSGAMYDSCVFETIHYCDVLREIYSPGASLQLKRVDEEKSFIVQAEGQDELRLMYPLGKRFGSIGYIELPPLKIDEKDYIDITQKSISDIDQVPTCGWIVDLRRHAGGQGPFLESVFPLLDPKSFLVRPRPPVAVLLSPGTASMGENTARDVLDFAEVVKSFGEQTWGNHPSVIPFKLSNGAKLGITTVSRSITPDVEVKNDWRYFQTDDDPVITAAIEWLMQQDTCKSE
jgi:C-terminal processing protease CtpA/Prc